MENYGVQCARTVLVRYVSFIPLPRRPCDMHGTTNVFLTILMQLLKTSEENGNVQYCFKLEWNF